MTKKNFQLWINNLKDVVKLNIEWEAKWYYEQCLFYLFSFDNNQVRGTLEKWKSLSNPDFWEIKRASILAEIGDLNEAERIAEFALAKIRSRLHPYSEDYALLSQEAWAMFLLHTIKTHNQPIHKENWIGDYRDRCLHLEKYRCNPQIEIESLAAIVDRPRPQPKPHKEEKKVFYPGTVQRTYNLFYESNLSKFIPAFQFLRIFEEGGNSNAMWNGY